MRLGSFISSVVALALGTSFVSGTALSMAPTTRFEFSSRIQNGTNLRCVLDSGICETTPDVTQISGYIDVGTNMSMWFWFFEARHSPETAPFTLWLNGGPGCSSMIGLFLENGPCTVNEDGDSTRLNPYSWNNVSNIIYIDQPIGTGFSYGTTVVNSTEAAAPFVWKAFQILFESKLFSKYASREFILGSESYGGHYGPAFVTYFGEQNALIVNGTIEGEPVVVSALMVNNGWFDPLLQNIAYYTFDTNAPGYGQLQPESVLKSLSRGLYGPHGCVALEKACYLAGDSAASNHICSHADDYCGEYVLYPSFQGLDPEDLRRHNGSVPFPPEYYQTYLRRPDVLRKIGAETDYTECSNEAGGLFVLTGDGARTWLPELAKLANSGLHILIWAGDTDINCNWLGAYTCVLSMDWYGNQTLWDTPLTNITLHGTSIASVVNVGNFSFARVYGAGHTLPAYKPAAAFDIFTQVVKKEPLHSV